MSPEGYDGGGGRNIAIIGAAILIISIALATTISNVRNSINHTSDNSRNGLGDDLPIKPSIPELIDTNTIQAFERALNENRGTNDIHILTTHIEGLEPYSEIVLPPGIEPGPLQWSEIMPNQITQNPLLDELLKNGAIILSTHDTNYGVDYRAAFQAALSQGSAINYPTRSGKEVTVAISDGGNHIEVTDALAETSALFWASLTPDGVLQLGLYSRGDDGNTLHNDLFASDFFLSTANWFGVENIQAVDGAWSELSSNTRSVNNRIEEIILNGIQTEEVPLVDAIRHTFTAKMAAKLGFTEVIIINTTPDPNNPGKYLNMNVRFKRPSNPTSLNSDPLPYYSELKLMQAKI